MVNCVYMILFYNVIGDLLYMHFFVRFCLKIISRIFKMWMLSSWFCIPTSLMIFLCMVGCVRMTLFYNLICDLLYMDLFVRFCLVIISRILKMGMCSSEFASQPSWGFLIWLVVFVYFCFITSLGIFHTWIRLWDFVL